MYLNTTHIIKFSPIDLPTSDVLNSLQKELEAGEIQSATQLTEGLSKYFPKILKITGFTPPFAGGLNIESSTLSVFEGGFGTYQLVLQLPEAITAEKVVEITDVLTVYIEDYISKDPHILKISKFFGNCLTDDGTDLYSAKLMWAYSQACVFETVENFERFSKQLSSEEIYVYNDCRVKFDPAVTVFYFDERYRLDVALQLVMSVTISTSIAYDIQNRAIEISRQILQTPNLESIFPSIERYVRLINVMDQYLTEIYQDDLIANLNEVVFARPLAVTFALPAVLEKAFRAVARLKDHIRTIENEFSRRQQKRMNNILISFTLMSIAGLAGSIISLYDFANQINPIIRLTIVFTTFFITSAYIIFLLKRVNYRN